MTLKFHENALPLFRDGKLEPEPEESLEELLRLYEKACDNYSLVCEKILAAARPYTEWSWINDVVPRIMEDSARNYSHRTWVNAVWSDITLALASDFSSPGEITTMRAAGDKHLRCQLSRNLKHILRFDREFAEEAAEIAEMIRSHHCYKEDGLRLNIAGNGLVTLLKSGIDTDMVTALLVKVFSACEKEGIKIVEVRSGGQSGVDEAGIKAAQKCGLECSILAPKGFRWRDGRGNEMEGKDRFVRRFRQEHIDSPAWEKARPDEYLEYAAVKYNAASGLDELQWDIDLKITHMNLADTELYEIAKFIVGQGNPSQSLIMRHFGKGYHDATLTMYTLEDLCVVSPIQGSKPRKLLMTDMDELDALFAGRK